jgi:hypothetical protein
MSQPQDFSAILQRLDAERRSLAREGESLEVLAHVTRVRRTDREGHSIAFSSLTEANADAAIAEQVAHYRAINAEMEWKVYGHDAPGDLITRLASHGFVIGPREAVMVLDLHSRPAWVDSAPAHPVLRVATPGHVALFRAAAEDIFEKDYQLTEGDITRALESGSTEHLAYIGLDGPQAVSIGRLYTHRDSAFGGLYGGGTRTTHRGLGWYRAVVAARARDAVQLGASYLLVDALPTSRPILERLGFERLTDTWPCELGPQRISALFPVAALL